MATVTKGRTFVSGETLTPSRLNELVDAATVTNIVNADISASAAITASKLQNPQYTGFRNRIINGNFDIWQRGTSHSVNGYGSGDRWRMNGTGSTFVMSRQPFSVGQTDVPNEPTYFNKIAVTSVAGAANNCNLVQRIEDVRTLAGQTATVSFYAKADAAKPIAIELFQFFGSGGSPSASVLAIGSQKFNLTTSWQKFTATISVPSISGKTIGSDNDSRLTVAFYFDAGSDFNSRTDTLGQQSGTFDIAQVQVEAGSVATPFEARPIGTELALCQRYFEKGVVGGATNSDANFNTGALATAIFTFMTEKRAAPTMTARDSVGTSNRFNGALDLTGSAGQSTTAGAIVNFARTSGWGTDMAATGLASNRFSYTYEASAEL